MSTLGLSGAGFVTAPPDDLPTASQSTLLLQKRKEMQEVQQQLDRKKEEFRARMQRCQEKEVDLAARQEDIKEQVRKFDKFLKDNDAKRVRADRKVQEEKKALVLKEKEKDELIRQLADQNEKRAMLKLEVENKSQYQAFLDSVCESSNEDFIEIESITSRYETLAAAQADLTQRVDAAQAQQEKEGGDYVQFVKSSQNDLLVYNSDIAKQQQDLDLLRYSTTDREAALSKGEVEAKEGTRQLGEIKMAIHNIHNRCVRANGAKAPAPESLEAFLDAIKQRVVDLQSIVVQHDGPVGLQELATIIRKREVEEAGKSKTAAADAHYSLPERLRGGDKPAAAAATTGGGESPGGSGGASAQSKAIGGKSVRPVGAPGDPGASASGGDVSRTAPIAA